MVMTVSHDRASSAGVAETAAPASTTGFSLSAERFHTCPGWPTSIRCCAMAAPILPIPATPTRMADALRLLHPTLDLVECGPRAFVIEIATGRTADADAADRLARRHDGHAARRE